MNDDGVTRRTVLRGTALGVLGAAALPAAATVTASAARAATMPLTLTVDTRRPGHEVSPDLYGAFFEEINYAGDGGLYAELIRNRAFMDPATPDQWYAPADIPRVPGKFGSALQLGGGSPAQYVLLPQGIVSGLADFTIAAWVNPSAITDWMRVFDFGDGENIYMFMTVAAGGTNNPRFAITLESNGHEQQLNAPSPLPLDTWSHLAVTLAGTTATLYVNGSPVDTNASMTLNPASLGPTTRNYIGRSQWPPDPYLAATVDEFQIYDRALTAAEVASLLTSAGGSAGGGNVVWYRFDEAKGDVAVDSSGNSRDGTLEVNTTDWTSVADGGAVVTAVLDAAAPLNGQLTRSARLDLASVGAGQRAGLANGGYFGVPVVPGQGYRVSFFARASGQFAGPVTVSLESADGSVSYASARVHGPFGADWKRHTTAFRVPRDVTVATDARFVIAVDNRDGQAAPVAGVTLWLQVVSVFPPTYRHRRNGLRPDLVELLKEVHPRILRFPGGNYMEGVTVATRWDWKKTIGPIWERPGHMNTAWGYWSDGGLGLLEYLQLCEDLDATPVMAVWAGYTLDHTVIAEADLARYVQDAVDQIEYAIGPVTSRWGARRAADGHPAPFRTPYVEIGNEDFFDSTGSYDSYRYPMFYDAIKAAYPRVKLIATTPVTSRPMDIIDQHYYSDAAFFEQASTLFDGYDRSGPLIFVGEYSATAGAGALPTGLLGNSVGEAAFMTGLERNSDVVHMSSYAPLFANYGHTQWNPDLIGYDQVRGYGSTSYWVQRMFARNVGDKVLAVTASAAGLYCSATIDSRAGRIYLKIVNPASQPVATQLIFAGRTAATARIEVLVGDPTAGNTLAEPDAIVPNRASLPGSGGVFDYQVPASSVTVVILSRE